MIRRPASGSDHSSSPGIGQGFPDGGQQVIAAARRQGYSAVKVYSAAIVWL